MILGATIYLYYWDIYKDWRLGSFKSKHFFLRDKLIFRPIVIYIGDRFNIDDILKVYYIIIILDGIFRFAWSYQLGKYQIPGMI
jgi:hypothetical protein